MTTFIQTLYASLPSDLKDPNYLFGKEKIVEKILNAPATNEEDMYIKGRIYFSKGQYKEAVDEFGAIGLTFSNRLSVINLHARALIALDKNSEAVDVCNEVRNNSALFREQASGEVFFTKGLAYAKQRKWQEAIAAYTMAIDVFTREKNDIGLERALYKRGRAYIEDKKFILAKQDFNRIIADINPNNFKAFHSLGYAAQEDAEEQIKNILPEEEKKRIKKELNNQARENFLQALGINPLYSRSESALGVIAGDIDNNYHQSLHYFERILSREPNNILALNNKSHALMKLQRFPDALDVINKALELLQNKAQVDADGFVISHITKAEIYVAGSQITEALQSYDDAIESDPNNILAYIQKGNYLLDLRKYDEAAIVFDDVLKMFPNHIEAKGKLSSIQNNGRYNEAEIMRLRRARLLSKLEIESVVPTDYECALMSNHVYHSERALPPGLANWEVVKLSNEDNARKCCGLMKKDPKYGYVGAAYKHRISSIIVIAHRGTVITDKHTREADIALLFDETPKMLTPARNFVDSIKKEFPGNKVIHTGHSLGAAVGEYLAMQDKVEATLFENTGSSNIVTFARQYTGDKSFATQKIRNYRRPPNPINTLGPCFGEERFIKAMPDEIAPAKALLSGCTAMTEYFLTVYHNHSMDGIIAMFDRDTGVPREQHEVLEWPSDARKSLLYWRKIKKMGGAFPDMNAISDADRREFEEQIGLKIAPVDFKRIKTSQFNHGEIQYIEKYILNNPSHQRKIASQITRRTINTTDYYIIEGVLNAEDFKRYIEKEVNNLQLQYNNMIASAEVSGNSSSMYGTSSRNTQQKFATNRVLSGSRLAVGSGSR